MTIRDLPRSLPGIDEIEVLIINDGSEDRTCEVAKECGVHHIVGFAKNRGLAKAFMCGMNASLERGADIIVNTDADNQYVGADISKLVEPLLHGKADVVIGDRETHTIDHFSHFKKFLQRHGSFIAGYLSGAKTSDATSGFRAFTREAALELNIISDFSYTLETLIQAGRKRLAVQFVSVRTNEKLRESRLFKNIFQFVKRSGSTMIRIYTTYEPLKVFLGIAAVFLTSGLFLFARFLIFYLQGSGGGHIQSLILGALLCLLAGFLAILGILADMITANRKLIEEILKRERDHCK